MNVNQEIVVDRFVAAIGELQASADGVSLAAMDAERWALWPQIIFWCLASIALVVVWMLGIWSLDRLG